MSLYQPGIPTGTVNLSIDYKNIQNNFSQLDTSFGIDHIPFSITENNGYHKVVHSVPFSTAGVAPANANNQPVVSPSTISDIGQIFVASINDGFTTDEALYFKTGDGRVLQLTSNVTPSAANNGYTFLPGGLFLQWGQVTSTVSSPFQTLTFATNNKAFPNACFAVFTQPYGTGTPPSSGEQATVVVRKSTVSATSFQWVYKTNSSQYTGFYWVAIGN